MLGYVLVRQILRPALKVKLESWSGMLSLLTDVDCPWGLRHRAG